MPQNYKNILDEQCRKKATQVEFVLLKNNRNVSL